jgi:hypothetical protein
MEQQLNGTALRVLHSRRFASSLRQSNVAKRLECGAFTAAFKYGIFQ